MSTKVLNTGYKQLTLTLRNLEEIQKTGKSFQKTIGNPVLRHNAMFRASLIRT